MTEQQQLQPKTTYTAVVGRVLAIKRLQTKLEQADVASRLAITQSTWSRIESGESALSIEQLAQAAAALGTSTAEIMMNVENALSDLRRQGVAIQYGSPRELAKEGLALIGVMALGALVMAAINAK